MICEGDHSDGYSQRYIKIYQNYLKRKMFANQKFLIDPFHPRALNKNKNNFMGQLMNPVDFNPSRYVYEKRQYSFFKTYFELCAQICYVFPKKNAKRYISAYRSGFLAHLLIRVTIGFNTNWPSDYYNICQYQKLMMIF